MSGVHGGGVVGPGSRRVGRRTFLARAGQLAGVAAGTGWLGACGTDRASTSEGSSGGSGGTISVGVEKNSTYTKFHQSQVAQFEKDTGITVKWVEVPLDNMHERFLAESIGGGGTIDVFQADQPWVAQFCAAGYFEPLSALADQRDLDDFLPVGLDALRYDGELYALPYLVHNSVLYYRTDLLKSAGFSAPPTQWDEYREMARALTNSSAGIFGTMAEGKNGIEPAAKFMDVLQQAGGTVLDDSGKVAFDAPSTLEAFNFLLGIQYDDKSSPPGAPGFDNADTSNLFLQGKLAMAPNWAYMYGLGMDEQSSKVVNKFSIALQPGKVKQAAQVSVWGYGIAKGSKRKQESFEFLKWASSQDMAARLGKTLINPVSRRSVAASIKEETSLTSLQRKAITVMTESVAASKTFPSNPKWPEISERLALAVNRIMTQQAKPQDEVSAAASDMRQIVG